MSSVTVSVILPSVTDNSKLDRLCSTLLFGKLEVELLVCTDRINVTSADFSTEYADKIRVFTSDNIDDAFRSAVANANGKFVLLSDENAVYAPEALEKMIVASQGGISVCNAGFVNSDGASKLMCSNFTVGDLGCVSVYCNYIIAKDIIAKNSIVPCGSDCLSIRLFIADCMRYENCNCLDEVLVYLSSNVVTDSKKVFAYIPEYAEIFKLTGNSVATLNFVNIVLYTLLPCLTNETFSLLKTVIRFFEDDFMLVEYIRSKYRIDTDMLCDEFSNLDDFKFGSTDIFYKEVTLPLLPDTVIRNFYSGKFGIDVLKKCIGAWMYYKFYRRKDDFVKKIGCKLSLKLLGGDFIG